MMFNVDVEDAVKEYADMVFRLTMINTKNRPDAEDVFQEVFLRLLKHKNKIENQEHLKAWLIRVTIRCCHKHFASSWKKRVKPVSYELLHENSYEMPSVDDSVLQLVRQLPELYRNIIHLFYYEEYSVKEIASKLDKSESSIKTGLFRARALLKDKLQLEDDYNE